MNFSEASPSNNKSESASDEVLDALAIKGLERRYGPDLAPMGMLWMHIWRDQFVKHFGSLAALRDKTVLDLGCGSIQPEENDRSFEPWFPRYMFELGAKPVGVDIGSLEGEPYEHYQIDLSVPGSLDFLPDKSFDIIHTKAFMGWNPSPILKKNLKDRVIRSGSEVSQEELLKQIRDNINIQIKRLLKDGGIFFGSDTDAGPR